MVKCCVTDCNVAYKDNPQNHSFHRFPLDPTVTQKWIRIIARPNWTPKKSTLICSKHFEEKYIRKRNKSTILLKGAIPTLFVPAEHSDWWTKKRLLGWFRSLPDDVMWNCMLCILVLANIVLVELRLEIDYLMAEEGIYDLIYAFHGFALLYQYIMVKESRSRLKIVGFVIDVLSYIHYPALISSDSDIRGYIKSCCFVVRIHRPFRYLLSLSDYNLSGNVIGTILKYVYLFLVTRVLVTVMWIEFGVTIDRYKNVKLEDAYKNQDIRQRFELKQGPDLHNLIATPDGLFFVIYYTVNKMFLPIGPDIPLFTDYERINTLILMVLGCFLVSGVAVSSLALVISVHIRPEEEFRDRFRLIMKDMEDTHMPPELRQKVETFYRMYWHKQKAVSVTQLLPIFPPTLSASVYTDIYFEAQQKSLILRDLSYQFLWEVAKVMSTIHYIPGDAIIQRSSTKSSIIYITYGDVEMLTAEDDDTPILRMTRGTILSPCGGCVSTACGRALVEIRAATFCTAHVLDAVDLWRVAERHGKHNGQAFLLLSAFEEHFEKVKRHYKGRPKKTVRYKSSILQFKRNLIALKQARDAKGNLLLGRTDYFLQIAGCYMMRNRADASLTEESDEICLRSTFPCILQPQSSLLNFWNIVVAILIVIVSLTHPYHLVFLKDVSSEFRFFDYVVTTVFVMDILVYLSIGANVEDGVPITFIQTSSQQMESIWFLIDVIATIPLFEFVGDGHFAGLNKLLKLPKVFLVLKSMEEVTVYHSNVLRFMAYTLMLLMSCWIIGCLHHSFRCFYLGQCVVGNFTHMPFWKPLPLDTATVKERVVYSLYWAISVVTFSCHKDGSLAMASRWYLWFITVVLEICCVFHVFIESVYSATIMVTTAMRDRYESCIDDVKNFLIRNNMDPMLRQRFITYLQLCWYTDKAYAITHQKRSIWFDLPPHVYHDIVARQRNKYIQCIPFMQYLNTDDLKYICSHAQLFYTSPNEILLNTGDVSSEIYVIKRGYCEILDPDTKKVIEVISSKRCFGDLECMLRFPAFYTVRAITHVQVFSISRKYLTKVIDMPNINDAIAFTKKQPEFRRVQMRRDPFIEYEPPPKLPNLARFPYPRKHIPDSAFLYPFDRLGFFSVLKYIFPRFTIRPDGTYIKRYEWFRSVCTLTTATVCPAFMYMKTQWLWFEYLALWLDLCSYFDMFQRMLVAYYDSKGILIYHPAATAAHYIKGAFIVDLFACLPLENLEADHDENPYLPRLDKYTSQEVAQFICLNRLVQLYRLPGAMAILNDYIQRRDIIVAIQALPVYIVMVNMVVSLMILHSTDIYSRPNSNPPWMTLAPSGSWIELFQNRFRFNITESPLSLHLTLYFWVVYETTTTGFNIFQPSHVDEIIIMSLAMAVAAVVTTYFSVLIISIRANVNKLLANYQGNIRDIRDFIRREKLPKSLDREVLAYYHYKWDKTGGLNYRNVLKLCDQITLRTDAILHIYGNTFNKCPILYHCDVSLIRIIGRAVHSEHFLQDTIIIEQDDVISDLYFVDYGTIEIRDAKDHTLIKLCRGSVFGNLDAVRTARCSNTIVAGSSVRLLKINALIFHAIIAEFSTVRVLMKKYRPHKEDYISAIDTSAIFKTLAMGSVSRISMAFVRVGQTRIVKFMSHQSVITQISLITISMLCIFVDVYNAAFIDNRLGLIIALYALDVLFYLKILVFSTIQLMVTEDEARDHLVSSRKKYIKSELKYDIISVIPLELFCLVDEEHKWRIFSLARLNRLFRIVTVSKSFERHLKRLSTNLVLTTIFSVTLWFSLFIHTTSCLWYAIGMLEEMRAPQSSWFTLTADSGQQCDNMYICSVYFVFSTFLQNGIGDVLPQQHSEVVFVIILQIVAQLMFMVYVGEFSNIIQYQCFRSFGFYYKVLELQEFLKNNRVSANLVALTNKYSMHLWRESRGMQVPHFLTHAPQCLKLKIMTAAYMHHFVAHPAFKDCEPTFLRQLVGCLSLYTYCEDIYVVKDSEITDAMYLIHKGSIQEIDEDMDDITAGRIYKAGEHFGMMEGLQRDVPFAYSYRAISKSQVLTLRLDDWEYLLFHFPISRYAIYKNVPGHPFSRRPPEPTPTPQTVKRQVSEDQQTSEQQPQSAGDTISKEARAETPDEAPAEEERYEDLWPMHSRRRSTIYDVKRLLPLGTSDHDLIPEEGHAVLPQQLPTESTAQLKTEPDIEPEIEPEVEPEFEFEVEPEAKPKVYIEEKKEDQPEKEKSVTSILSEEESPFQREEALLHRRKTLFEKVADTAKKLVQRRSTVIRQDGKDSLLLEEERAATKALLDRLNAKDDDQAPHTHLPDDAPSMRLRAATLSFRPGQFDDEEEEDFFRPTTSYGAGARRSVLPGFKEEIIDDDDIAPSRRRGLSFLPGLVADDQGQPVSSEKSERGDKDDEAPIIRRGRGLSFLPGLVQKDDEEQPSTSQKTPRRSILAGISDRDDIRDEDDEAPVRRGRGLSFLPGLVQKDDQDQPSTSQRAPRRSILAGITDKSKEKTGKSDASTTSNIRSVSKETNTQTEKDIFRGTEIKELPGTSDKGELKREIKDDLSVILEPKDSERDDDDVPVQKVDNKDFISKSKEKNTDTQTEKAQETKTTGTIDDEESLLKLTDVDLDLLDYVETDKVVTEAKEAAKKETLQQKESSEKEHLPVQDRAEELALLVNEFDADLMDVTKLKDIDSAENVNKKKGISKAEGTDEMKTADKKESPIHGEDFSMYPQPRRKSQDEDVPDFYKANLTPTNKSDKNYSTFPGPSSSAKNQDVNDQVTEVDELEYALADETENEKNVDEYLKKKDDKGVLGLTSKSKKQLGKAETPKGSEESPPSSMRTGHRITNVRHRGEEEDGKAEPVAPSEESPWPYPMGRQRSESFVVQEEEKEEKATASKTKTPEKKKDEQPDPESK